MTEINLTSREYKLILRATRFSGDEQQLVRAARRFWDDFERLVVLPELKREGSLDAITADRTITFCDTVQHLLYDNDYNFRLRQDKGGKLEATLKFRHLDRFVARDRNMAATAGEKPTTKLEHDIKPSFDQLYSHSTTIELPKAKASSLQRLKDLSGLFPGLEEGLDFHPADDPIVVVNGFEAHELVLTGGKFFLGKDPGKETECALIVWYGQGDKQRPAIVEFSFRYGDKQGDFSRQAAGQAYEVFRRLQALEAWVDASSPTKTAYVYNRGMGEAQ
jgi:hypothetical protein